MKTTLDIDDELLALARRHAANTGQTLGDVIEDGLRRVLSSVPPPQKLGAYRLPDCSYGDPTGECPLSAYSWSGLRELIYGSELARQLNGACADTGSHSNGLPA